MIELSAPTEFRADPGLPAQCAQDFDEFGDLRAEAREVCAGSSRNVAIIDLPHFVNCGDSAILLGQLDAIHAQGQVVRVTAHRRTFRPADIRRALPAGSTVYLQGGGSFGDLYPPHHEFRLRVIEALPDYRIVMMPQSCFWRDGHADARTISVARSHPDLTLYFRDRRSLEIAADTLGVPVRLAPDMACHLNVARPPRRPGGPVLWVGRHDDESIGAAVPPGTDLIRVDWALSAGWPGLPNRLRNHAADGWLRAAGRTPLATTASAGLVGLAQRRTARALELLSAASVVVTERLHGHILATLLGVPNVTIDSGYGKVSGFVQTWTADLPHVRVAHDVASALEAARELSDAPTTIRLP